MGLVQEVDFVEYSKPVEPAVVAAEPVKAEVVEPTTTEVVAEEVVSE